jgi:hypothetical protein
MALGQFAVVESEQLLLLQPLSPTTLQICLQYPPNLGVFSIEFYPNLLWGYSV